jgi:hypothetical protein
VWSGWMSGLSPRSPASPLLSSLTSCKKAVHRDSLLTETWNGKKNGWGGETLHYSKATR